MDINQEAHSIKAVLSDVDATQVINGSEIPTLRVQQAARALRHNNIPLLNVTARSHRLLLQVAQPLDLRDNLCAIDGGATVARATSGEVLWSKWLTPEIARDVCLAIGALSTRIYYNPDSRHLTKDRILSDLRSNILPDYSPAIFAVFEAGRSQAIGSALRDIPEIQHTPIMEYKGTEQFRCIQVASLGVDKQTGGAKMLELAGLAKEPILAIGDGTNDLSLFALAKNGIKVAMGNACSELKEQADWVAPSVEDDGFAAAMHHFRLIA